MGASDLTLMPSDPRLERHDDLKASPALLVRRAVAGDRESFEALFALHERRVLRTALRLLGRMELAQDAAQEVFLRMHRYLARFEDGRELGPWLYRMVVNVCHDIRRRNHGRIEIPLDDADRIESPASGVISDVELRLEQDQRRRFVARALERLPEKERAALVLRDIEGLSTSEVARILGSSETTVRSQACTARMKVKKLVEGFMEKRR